MFALESKYFYNIELFSKLLILNVVCHMFPENDAPTVVNKFNAVIYLNIFCCIWKCYQSKILSVIALTRFWLPYKLDSVNSLFAIL